MFFCSLWIYLGLKMQPLFDTKIHWDEVYAALDAGVQLIGPECAIPLKTKLENLIEIPAAVEDWAAERGTN